VAKNNAAKEKKRMANRSRRAGAALAAEGARLAGGE
jgi:hypothetical protein